jgi:hypothetical protein
MQVQCKIGSCQRMRERKNAVIRLSDSSLCAVCSFSGVRCKGITPRWRTALFALAMLCGSAPAATSSQISMVSQSAAPGSSILLPIAFVSDGASISGVQFDLEYDQTAMTLAPTLGDAPRQSGKCMYTADLSSNRTRILIVGLNQNHIADGTLVNLFVNVSVGAPQGSYPMKISEIVGTDPSGVLRSILGGAGTLTVDASNSIARLQPNGVLNAASFAGPIAPRRNHYSAWVGDRPTVCNTLRGVSRCHCSRRYQCAVGWDRRAVSIRCAQPDQRSRSIRGYAKATPGAEITVQTPDHSSLFL